MESSKMKCNLLSGKLFLQTKQETTNKVAYESLHSIKNRRKSNNI